MIAVAWVALQAVLPIVGSVGVCFTIPPLLFFACNQSMDAWTHVILPSPDTYLADGTNEGQEDYSRSGIADQIFGIPLEVAVRLSKISATTGVPAVISRCIEYLDIMGVEEVGLYRVPGSTSNVARLKAMFDHGKEHSACVLFMKSLTTN